MKLIKKITLMFLICLCLFSVFPLVLAQDEVIVGNNNPYNTTSFGFPLSATDRRGFIIFNSSKDFRVSNVTVQMSSGGGSVNAWMGGRICPYDGSSNITNFYSDVLSESKTAVHFNNSVSSKNFYFNEDYLFQHDQLYAFIFYYINGTLDGSNFLRWQRSSSYPTISTAYAWGAVSAVGGSISITLMVSVPILFWVHGSLFDLPTPTPEPTITPPPTSQPTKPPVSLDYLELFKYAIYGVIIAGFLVVGLVVAKARDNVSKR